MQTIDEAREALAAIGDAQHDLTKMACPPWRHAAFAGLMAVWVASPAVPLPLRMGVLVLMLVAVALIVRSDKRRLGVFINGYRRGKTLLVVVPLMLVLSVLYGVSFYYGDMHGRSWVSIVLALVALVVAYLGSSTWQRVFVRELGR